MGGCLTRKNTKKYKALKLLAQGKTQSEISRALPLALSKVCEYKKEFLDKKWIKVNIPGAYVKTYRATPNAPISTTGGKGKPLHSGDQTRLHNTRFKLKILEPIRREITWDKTVSLKNNVKKQYLYFPSATIEKIKDTIVIHLHERYLDELTTETDKKILRDDMLVIRAWLQKVLLCKVSRPILIQQKHYAKPIRNPETMRLLEKVGKIKIGDVWIDASKKGFQYGELESTDPDKLKLLERLEWADQHIPERVQELEQENTQLKQSIDQLVQGQQQLINMLTQPVKKPSKYDISYI